MSRLLRWTRWIKAFLDLLLAIKQETTVLFLHIFYSDVEQISDYVAILHQGKIKLFGEMEELKTQFRQEDYLLQFASSQETEHFCQLAKGAAINWTRGKTSTDYSRKSNFSTRPKSAATHG